MTNHDRTMSISVYVAILTTAILGISCASVHRPDITVSELGSDANVARSVNRATVDSIIERLARRAAHRNDGTLDILMLSGGGQNGAYGAGFLKAWKGRSDGRMPDFDLVTGVSTGALQAPLALLGTQDDLELLSSLYREATRTITPSVDYLFWLHPNGGVLNVERYEATLARVVDPRLSARLRSEFDKDRQVAVSTADMDLGTGRIWSFTDEMKDTAETSRRRVHTLLQASSAIPGIFPPLLIDNHVHTDGGTISNLLTVLTISDYRRLAERMRYYGVTSPVKVRIWAIMNMRMHVPIKVTDIASRSEISRRGNLLLLVAQQPQVLSYLDVLSTAVSATIPGLSMELRYTSIPASLPDDPAAAELFNEGWMHRLDSTGAGRASGSTPWDAIMSPYERPATD